MANYSEYRILWTSPNLPYSGTNSIPWTYLYGSLSGRIYNNYYYGDENYAGTHDTTSSLEYDRTLTLAAQLQGYTWGTFYPSLLSYVIANDSYPSYIRYRRWASLESEVTFYIGDYSETDLPVNPETITSITNTNTSGSTQSMLVTAVARINDEIVAKDCITIYLISGQAVTPDPTPEPVVEETDFGIFIKYGNDFDSSTQQKNLTMTSAPGGITDASTAGHYIEVYCQEYGNTLTEGSVVFQGDDYIYMSSEVEYVNSKKIIIHIELDESEGYLYKELTGKFIITGASNPQHRNILNVTFEPFSIDSLLNVNTESNNMTLFYSNTETIEVSLNSIDGLVLGVDSSLVQDSSGYSPSTCKISTVYDSSISALTGTTAVITIQHDADRLVNDVVIDLIINAVDPEDSTVYQSRIIEITFNHILMPYSIEVVINQIRRKIYFEIKPRNENPIYIDASGNVVAQQDSSTKTEYYYKDASTGAGDLIYEGDSYTLPGIYPAQGDNINNFTKKYKIACHGSDWICKGAVDASGNSIEWIQTSLDEGLDYDVHKAEYTFAIWANVNPYIEQRTGYIVLESTKTKLEGGEKVPRAIVTLEVVQEGAKYEPDFSVRIIPAVEVIRDGDSSTSIKDSSINSAFTLAPVYGKTYYLRVTNNCPYDILHVSGIEVEGPKIADSSLYYINQFPDIDASIDTSDENIDIDRLEDVTTAGLTQTIYGSAYDASTYESQYYSKKVLAFNLPALGVIDSSASVLHKYVSFKITCYNESYGNAEDASGNTHFKSINTDPRHLHQTGLLRIAGYEGYDEKPEVLDEADRLYSFVRKISYEAADQEIDAAVFSVRTGLRIHGVEGDQKTGSSTAKTGGTYRSDVNGYNPVWNNKQILDERCIVLSNDLLDDFLKED